MSVLAGAALVLALVSLGWNLVVAYRTEGGAIGMVPVLAAPVFHQGPLVTLGLFLFASSRAVAVNSFVWVLVYLVSVCVFLVLTAWAGRLKARRRSTAAAKAVKG